MDHGQLSMVADKFQWVFSEALLNTCGKDVKFCRRQRGITPFRLGLALTATCASQHVETIADFHGGFNALFGTTVTYKAFYNQVAKPHFADFARTMTARLVGDMTLQVLGVKRGKAFAEFHHIVIQDGSSFALHDGLREVCPGRFKVVKPAAVELHTAMDLLCDTPTTVVLTPDTTSEQAFLPEPPSLRGSVLLADRGYIDLHYLRRVQDEGGFFVIRAKAGMNPQVLEAFREDGKRWRSLRNKPLQTIHAKLPKRQRVELRVQWHVDGHPLCLRLVISWNRRTKSFCYLLTNLPPQRYPLDTICRAYKWRWPVELVFKKMKQLLRLNQLRSTHRTSVEATVRALLIAWALQESTTTLLRALLCATASPESVVVRGWLLSGLGLETLRQQVQGRWSEARLQACLPRLHRFLCSRPRRRGHQESAVRTWLEQRAGAHPDRQQKAA